MRTLRFVVGGTMLLAVWLPAVAQAQESGGFQGLYVGALGSYSSVDQDVTTTQVLSGFQVLPPAPPPPAPPPPPPPPEEETCPIGSEECFSDGSARATGLQGTLLLGYRTPLHHAGLLAGGEFDISFGQVTSEYEGYQYGMERLTTLRGVLGSEIHPGIFLFSTGGLGWMQVTADDLADDESADATVHGWVYGGGAEVALGKHGGHDWLLRADYLRGHFKDWTFQSDAGVPGLAAPATPTLIPLFDQEKTVKPEVLQFRLGISVKLGGN